MPDKPNRLISEELLGAELVASKELAEAAGSVWEANEKVLELQRQQLCWFFQDYTEFWGGLRFDPDPMNLFRAASGLAAQRAQHISRGWQDFGSIMKEESEPFVRAWSGFMAVVRRDWEQNP